MLSATRRAPDDFGLGSVQLESISPRRRYTQTSEVEAVQYLSGDSCHISAYRQHTNVDADCTSQQAAISRLYIARTVSVQGPILMALHTGHLWVAILICNSG